MYSREERIKAIELYIKYDFSAADTMRTLGYPEDRRTLQQWHIEYQRTGKLHETYRKQPVYSQEQKQMAVDYYLEHGRNISRTTRAIGYPARETLREWIKEISPNALKVYKKQTNMISFSKEQKQEAVINFCTREHSAVIVAKELGVSRQVLYKWKKEILGEDIEHMKKQKKQLLSNDKNTLAAEVESLKKQIYQQQIELDILKKAAEIIKKDQGINLKGLTNKEKASLIDALRESYPLKELLNHIKMARSSYFYHHAASKMPNKYIAIKKRINQLFHENCGRYGYRRIHALLKREGIDISEKVVRKIMSELGLFVMGTKKRKFNSYQGEHASAAENLLERDFKADKPNTKWLTDITEFHIPAGKVYLSPIVDCFDGMLASWTIGTSPNASLVNTMLDNALHSLKYDEKPLIHSDRGGHYRWAGWLERIKNAGLTRSMSKKGCCPDNAACEGFFGRIKNEMFYNRNWIGVSIDQFMDILNDYLKWYNEKRIKISLGFMSPLEYRMSNELIV